MHRINMRFAVLIGLMLFVRDVAGQQADSFALWPNLYQPDNLVAWCIVPFDAANRTPAQRVDMLVELGIERCAYDWRDEHVASFEEEFELYQKHGIELFAFWGLHDKAFELFKKFNLRPQIWLTAPDPGGDGDTKVARSIESLLPAAKRTAELNLPLGLYNHGGWGGEPENMVAVCEQMHKLGYNHVGIVYNFHHGHDHIHRWHEALTSMMPYLLCVNLNGMNTDAQPKILAIGKGQHDSAMMRTLVESGYTGRIGIIGHQEQFDVKQVLLDNFAGLQTVARKFEHEAVERLVADAIERGNANRGAAVFGSDHNACVSCHSVEHPVKGKIGGDVGPDLARILHERTDYQIVDSLFYPQREVAPEYRLWQIVTVDGSVHSGFVDAKESDQSDDASILLREVSKSESISIDRDDLESITQGGSPMPDGLMARLTTQQKLDLIHCLIELKKSGTFNSQQLDVIEQSYSHGFAKFPYSKAPLNPARWPHHTAYVNRDRPYDFYTKQAEFFRQQGTSPLLLEPYPGLDGGVLGHWGNQNEQSWADGRWNDTILGSVHCGVFRYQGMTVPRGICVQLGEPAELSCCFDPDNFSYPAIWRNGFVKFSSVRHGFMDAVAMQGELVGKSMPNEKLLRDHETKSRRYLGFYRLGQRVVFKYEIDGQIYLDAPWVENGKFTTEIAPIARHSFREQVAQGSAAQWPEKIETNIRLGDQEPFAIDTISLPVDNPWKALLFPTGHDFLPNGAALICTMEGDVWHVQGFVGDKKLVPAQIGNTATWKRFAAGLNQPLGLLIDDDGIFVQCRDQLVRLTDFNGDGEADFYECFSNSFETSAAGHDFICDLQRDSAGNFYTVSGNQGLVQISADGRTARSIATGFRNPDGLGLMPDGTLTVPCSEGDWTPASMICAIPSLSSQATQSLNDGRLDHIELPFYGYGGPRDGKPPKLPLVYLPRGLDNSSGGQAMVPNCDWGGLENQMLHLSFGAGSWFNLLIDEIDGVCQGGVALLAGDFLSGVHRGRFNRLDKQFYVTGMNGWGTYTPDDGCFQRVRYTGKPFQHPVGFHAYRNGLLIEFTQDIDSLLAQDLGNHFAQCWNYRYSGGYGSDEYSPSHPGVVGHDHLPIISAHVIRPSTLFLEIPDIQPVNQLHLRMHVNEPDQFASANPVGDGHDVFLTIHRLDDDFTNFPGYEPVEKTIAAHPMFVDLATASIQRTNPWLNPVAEHENAILIRTGKNLSYELSEFTVKAGEPIALALENPDVVPHNWVLIQPDRLADVGKLVDQLIAKPEAHARHYVPDSPDVIVYTDIVAAGQSQTIHFRAPNKPGRYPYLCTFPGHSMVMNGVMVVE